MKPTSTALLTTATLLTSLTLLASPSAHAAAPPWTSDTVPTGTNPNFEIFLAAPRVEVVLNKVSFVTRSNFGCSALTLRVSDGASGVVWETPMSGDVATGICSGMTQSSAGFPRQVQIVTDVPKCAPAKGDAEFGKLSLPKIARLTEQGTIAAPLVLHERVTVRFVVDQPFRVECVGNDK